MPLSPHEEEVLATLERELRADPELAAVLDSAPQSVPAGPPVLLRRQVVFLVAVLAGLAAVAAVAAEQLGTVGLGALTCVATVPWLVATTRSADRRSRAGAAARARRPSTARTSSTRRLLLGALLVVYALAVLPPSWRGVVGMLLSFALLPLTAWFALGRRRST